MTTTVFRSEADYPEHPDLRRVDRRHAHAAGAVPGPLRTAERESARPHDDPARASGSGRWPPSTAASSRRTAAAAGSSTATSTYRWSPVAAPWSRTRTAGSTCSRGARRYPPGSVVLARQNLPLIVVNGKPNPALDATQQWGYTLNNAVRVWRTALGVDATRQPDLRGRRQADGAQHRRRARSAPGAVRGVELDINAEWPTFNVYAAPGCQEPVQDRPQHAAARDPLPEPRRPRLLRRLCAAAGGLRQSRRAVALDSGREPLALARGQMYDEPGSRSTALEFELAVGRARQPAGQ